MGLESTRTASEMRDAAEVETARRQHALPWMSDPRQSMSQGAGWQPTNGSADHGLVFQEFLDPVLAHLPADPGKLEPAVRSTHVDRCAIDADASGADPARQVAG